MQKSCNATSYLRGYKVKLYPTESQKEDINRTIDIYRAVYNLALEIQNEKYEYSSTTTVIDVYSMNTLFSKLRNSEEYSWMRQIPLNTVRQAVLANCYAFKNYLSGSSYYPKFKSKKKSKKNFNLYAENVAIKGSYIKIPGIGLVDAKRHIIPEGVRLHKTAVSFDGKYYWFSCSIERPAVDMSDNQKTEPVGLDIGKKKLIVSSDGTEYNLSDTSKLMKRLHRQQLSIHKDSLRYLKESKRTRTKYDDLPKSKNHVKRLEALYKTERKIINKKLNDIHKATKEIVSKNPSAIVIEDLVTYKYDREDWLKDRFYIHAHEVRRQLEYKAEERGIPIFLANKYYPSSQICSNCGHRREPLRAKNRLFVCPVCGYQEDRDYNAAKNLKSLAFQQDGIVYEINA